MKSEIKNDVLIVSFQDKLIGTFVSGQLTDLLNMALKAGTTKVLFNMAEITYVDSSGLGLLLNAVSKINQAGGVLVLCSIPGQMEKLLKLTKLETMFNRQPDEVSAMAFLNV